MSDISSVDTYQHVNSMLMRIFNPKLLPKFCMIGKNPDKVGIKHTNMYGVLLDAALMQRDSTVDDFLCALRSILRYCSRRRAAKFDF